MGLGYGFTWAFSSGMGRLISLARHGLFGRLDSIRPGHPLHVCDRRQLETTAPALRARPSCRSHMASSDKSANQAAAIRSGAVAGKKPPSSLNTPKH
jgi:hypothetical protein